MGSRVVTDAGKDFVAPVGATMCDETEGGRTTARADGEVRATDVA